MNWLESKYIQLYQTCLLFCFFFNIFVIVNIVVGGRADGSAWLLAAAMALALAPGAATSERIDPKVVAALVNQSNSICIINLTHCLSNLRNFT